FLSDARQLDQRVNIPGIHATDKLVGIESGQYAQRQLGPDPVDLDQQAEQIAVQRCDETIQALGVLANGEVGMQDDLTASVGKVKEGGVGNVDFVTQSRAFNQRPGRGFFDELS